MIVGMRLEDTFSIDIAAIYYLATLQALCYDSKYIIETMTEKKKLILRLFILLVGFPKMIYLLNYIAILHKFL